MKFVYCGDVVARAGREAVLNNLSALKETYKPDAVIVNIENSVSNLTSEEVRKIYLGQLTNWSER